MRVSTAPRVNAEDIFNRVALKSRQAGAFQRSAKLVHLAPRWTKWAFRALPAILLVALVLAGVVRVTEYAEGPALVRSQEGVHLVAHSSGTVLRVLVSPGERVKPGQGLVQLSDEEERLELARLRREWEINLVALLREPPDAGSRDALIALRVQAEKAERRLRERMVRAESEAMIGDVWAHIGQKVDPGHRLVSLVPSDSPPGLVLALPGHALPFLRPGMPLRLELQGFAEERQDLQLSSHSQEIVGPTEARRYLGHEQAEPLALQGPVALARVTLPSRSFIVDGREYRYRAGLVGRVYVPLRTHSLLELVLPFLRRLREGVG
jgi:multidrug resistance efflux pump